jgi:hypothetical protein
MRPSKILAIKCTSVPRILMLSSKFGVCIGPGLIALIRMFQEAYSAASTFVSVATPAFAAQ